MIPRELVILLPIILSLVGCASKYLSEDTPDTSSITVIVKNDWYSLSEADSNATKVCLNDYCKNYPVRFPQSDSNFSNNKYRVHTQDSVMITSNGNFYRYKIPLADLNHNQYGKAVYLFKNDSLIQFEDLYKDDYCPVPIQEINNDFRFCTDSNSTMMNLILIKSDNEFNYQYLDLRFSEGKVISTLRKKNVAQKSSNCATEWQKEIEISQEDQELLTSFFESARCYKFKKNLYLHTNDHTGFVRCFNNDCHLYYPEVTSDLEVNPDLKRIIRMMMKIKSQDESTRII